MVAAVPVGDDVELYGMVSVDEDSVFWPDVVSSAILSELNDRAHLIARDDHAASEAAVLAQLRRDHYRHRGLLTRDVPNEPAIRRGTVREVERLQTALHGLLSRCSTAVLPSEVSRKTTGQFMGTSFSHS